MIGYLEGKLLKKDQERFLLLVGGVGYEILVPKVVAEGLEDKAPGDACSFYIYHHQTERQPKPVLIGFENEIQREFFERFLSVEDIGPIKAVTALCLPMARIAQAIESRDVGELRRLKGIGERTAHKIVAALNGKMGRFCVLAPDQAAPETVPGDLWEQAMDVLVHQLGHKVPEARDMIARALKRNPDVSDPGELLEEIYRKEPGS